MSKKAILLANLGSPDSPAVRDVRSYLREFLMDERVIDIPGPIRSFLVKGIIVPLRAPQSAAKYRSIWTENGSPLIHTTRLLTELVATQSGLPAYMCMRYANPAPLPVLQQIAAEHPDLEELVMVPLYPHYAMSSYETAVEYAKTVHAEGKYPFKLSFIKPYYREPDYLHALTESIKPFLEQEYDHILFSYHGVPERHIFKGDITGQHCLKTPDCCAVDSPAHKQCYRHQCVVTTELVAGRLSLPAGKYSYSFQSRLGRDEWLKPYTAGRFEDMPGEGIKKLLVVCPAFVSDCLETLEEIAEEGKESFLHAGGESFTMIPCLNVHPLWVQAVAGYVQSVAAGNPEMVLT